MRLPTKKVINKKVYSHYDFEPYPPKRIKWKRKLKCKNRQIRRLINRILNKMMEE